MPSRYNQIGTDSSSPSTIRQQQLLEHLQQQRILLQRQKQQLTNLLLFPISPSNLTRNTEIANPDPSHFAEDLAPYNLPSSPKSPPSSSTRAQFANLPDGRSDPQQQQHDPGLKQPENEEDEQMNYDRNDKITNGRSGSSLPVPKALEDEMPSASDFVKKLYRMLEDPTFQSVVCWGPMGDCFIVKDMNECTKSVLPRLFKHSNFASFVRQLNKYDFHKVKSTENNPYGEQSWTFRHPDFHADRPEALENIRRKPPAQRKSAAAAAAAPAPSSIPGPSNISRSDSYSPSPYEKKPTPRRDSSVSRDQFKAEVQPLLTDTENLRDRIAVLEQNYERVLQEMAGLQRGMAQQDKLIHSLILSFLQKEGKQKALTDGFPIDLQPHIPYSSTAPRGAIGPPPGAQVYQPPEIGPLQGSSSNPMGRPDPSPSISLEQLREQIQAYLNHRNPMSYSASSLPSSSSTLPLTRHQATASGSVYSDSQLPSSSSSQPERYNIPNESWQNPFPQSANTSSNQVPLLNSSEQQQQPSMPYIVSSPANTMSQTINEQFSPPSSVESLQNNKGSIHSQVAPPNITWDKTWETMMASPFSLTPLPGFNTGAENELNDDGLQVYTVGHLLPRPENKASSSLSPLSTEESLQGNWNFGANAESPVFDKISEDGVEETVQPTITNPTEGSVQPQASTGIVTPAERQKLRVRRSTFVPGWAVPPHVLLVDDDAVSRRLSSKFLEVFGCTVEVAVDGIGAVNKMNLEKYDLVLMDIVMPKLDGVSATNLIRKFDKGTPIISMTGNSNPNQIMTYFSSGMNDILPKPFTKKGLLDMLEKHLVHLKVISQISKVPRPVGVPPMSDSNFKQALATSANNLFLLQQQQQQQQHQTENSTSGALTPFRPITPPGSNVDRAMTVPSSFDVSLFDDTTDEAQINPLAGMGVSDDQYKILLQNIVNGDGFPGIMQSMSGSSSSSSSTWGSEMGMSWSSPGFSEKRPLDDPDFEREEKRSRFEVIE